MLDAGFERTGTLVIRAWIAPGQRVLIARITSRPDLAAELETSQAAAGARTASRIVADWLDAFQRTGVTAPPDAPTEPEPPEQRARGRGRIASMSDPNVLEPRWDAELLDAPFRLRAARVGAHAGSGALGATLYEIEPGGRISPYHVHHGNEELLVVLAGAPELRTPGGTRTLAPGAVVAFPAGPDGAHAVRNPGAAPARVLLVSTMRFPDVAEHLDTGATLTITGPAEGQVFPAGAAVPVGEAVAAATAADAEQPAP